MCLVPQCVGEQPWRVCSTGLAVVLATKGKLSVNTGRVQGEQATGITLSTMGQNASVFLARFQSRVGIGREGTPLGPWFGDSGNVAECAQGTWVMEN